MIFALIFDLIWLCDDFLIWFGCSFCRFDNFCAFFCFVLFIVFDYFIYFVLYFEC